MERREFLGVVAASTVGGCTSWAEKDRDCSDLESVDRDPFCSRQDPASLEIDPGWIETPATVTFTVVNNDDRDLVVERSRPRVYRQVDSEWQEDRYFRARWAGDRVTVSDRHSYEKEVPFGSWDPEPGEYLVLVPAQWDSTQVFRRQIRLGDFLVVET